MRGYSSPAYVHSVADVATKVCIFVVAPATAGAVPTSV